MSTKTEAVMVPEPELVQWFTSFIEERTEAEQGRDGEALIACLDRVRDSYRYECVARPATAAPVGVEPEVIARLSEVADDCESDVTSYVLAGSVAKEHASDIRVILASLRSPEPGGG